MRVASIDIDENCMWQIRAIAIQCEDISVKNKSGKIQTKSFLMETLTKSMLAVTNKSLTRSQKKKLENDPFLKLSKSEGGTEVLRGRALRRVAKPALA
jgi:hypothetical protein